MKRSTLEDDLAEVMYDRLKINDILYTKDGRFIGNAIVVGIKSMEGCATVYVLKTDYGNITEGTRVEIQNAFWTKQRGIPKELKAVFPHKHAVEIG